MNNKRALVIYVDADEIKKIDGIAAALGVTRSETARKLLNLAMATLRAKIPVVLEEIDKDLARVRQESLARQNVDKAADIINERFAPVIPSGRLSAAAPNGAVTQA